MWKKSPLGLAVLSCLNENTHTKQLEYFSVKKMYFTDVQKLGKREKSLVLRVRTDNYQ